MAELRRDPIVGRMVIIAPERAARPHEFVDRPHTERVADCPFCEGSEVETPGELAAVRDPATKPNESGWRVRVVPNKYPAVEPFGSGPGGTDNFVVRAPQAQEELDGRSLGRVPRTDNESSVPPSARGVLAAGVHEVIIESPRHLLASGSLSVDELTDVLKTYRDRLRTHRTDPRLRYVQIFKNVGEAAGASIEHLHSQLIGTEFVPPAIVDELKSCGSFHAQTGRCLFCDLIESELKARERVVAATDAFAALCPYASRFPYEVWVLPRAHAERFEEADDLLMADAARMLHGVLRGIEKLLASSGVPSVGYNYVLHSAPFDSSEPCYYHWHIEVLPRAVKQAGFEWSTGVHINPVAPEDAATVLRELDGATQA